MKHKVYIVPTTQVVCIESEHAIALSFTSGATNGLGNELDYGGESDGDMFAGSKDRKEWDEL